MPNKVRVDAKIVGAILLLSFGILDVHPIHASNAKSQADVDAQKTSKDDNQTQIKSSRNSHKEGTPLPFEGPPAKSGAATSNTTTTSSDKKP